MTARSPSPDGVGLYITGCGGKAFALQGDLSLVDDVSAQLDVAILAYGEVGILL